MTSTISGGTSALNRSSPLPPVFTAEEPPALVYIGRFWKPVHDWTSFSMAILCFSLHLCEVFGHCQVQMLVTTSVISLLPLTLTHHRTGGRKSKARRKSTCTNGWPRP